jgi:hypothetical protein
MAPADGLSSGKDCSAKDFSSKRFNRRVAARHGAHLRRADVRAVGQEQGSNTEVSSSQPPAPLAPGWRQSFLCAPVPGHLVVRQRHWPRQVGQDGILGRVPVPHRSRRSQRQGSHTSRIWCRIRRTRASIRPETWARLRTRSAKSGQPARSSGKDTVSRPPTVCIMCGTERGGT